jgi:hypothetical protein
VQVFQPKDRETNQPPLTGGMIARTSPFSTISSSEAYSSKGRILLDQFLAKVRNGRARPQVQRNGSSTGNIPGNAKTE